MENEIGKIGIGKEQPPMEAKDVMVKAYRKEAQTKPTGEAMGDKIILSVRYPGIEKEVELSGVSYLKSKKIAESGLWLRLDGEGKINYMTAVAHMLRFYKCATLDEIVGRTIQTTHNEKHYLIVKAY